MRIYLESQFCCSILCGFTTCFDYVLPHLFPLAFTIVCKADFFLFLLKIKVLTDLGFFSDAFHELGILNFGEKVPWKLPGGYKYILKSQVKMLSWFCTLI